VPPWVGLGPAERYHARGAQVVVTGRDRRRLDEVRRFGPTATGDFRRLLAREKERYSAVR
jgi:short-subunit dehydrogenase involved in D-alanine esterification of teichoic acids